MTSKKIWIAGSVILAFVILGIAFKFLLEPSDYTIAFRIVLGLGFLIFLYFFLKFFNQFYAFTQFLHQHLNIPRKGVILLRKNGKILYANRNFFNIIGLNVKRYRGRTFNEIFNHNPQIRNFINRLKSGEEHLESELTYFRQQKAFKGQIIGYRIRDMLGKPVGYCLEIYDLSESILNERQMVIHRLIRKMAHDIKTPLSTIKFSLQTMRYGLGTEPQDEEVLEALTSIENEISRIQSITDNYSKVAGLSRLKVSVIALEELLQTIVNDFHPPQNVKVEIKVAKEAQVITADAEQLSVMLKEVLENAFDAVSGEGQITIETFPAFFADAPHKEAICIKISDNGDGIAPEIKEHIFEPNFSTKTHGTGLGLVFVQQIVENLGGQILVDSEQGKGTQVQLILPREIEI